MILVNGQQIRNTTQLTSCWMESHSKCMPEKNRSDRPKRQRQIDAAPAHLPPSEHRRGNADTQKELTIGYLPQIPVEFEGLTVYEVLAYGCRHLTACQQEMTALEHNMAEPGASADSVRMQGLLNAYASVQERFERGGGYEMDAAIDSVAIGLQISKETYARQFSTFSGGEKHGSRSLPN